MSGLVSSPPGQECEGAIHLVAFEVQLSNRPTRAAGVQVRTGREPHRLSPMNTASSDVHLLGIRALEGPNLYFPRPAIRVTVDATAWLQAPSDHVERTFRALKGRPIRAGEVGSASRVRSVLRLFEAATRGLAHECGTPRLGVRVREGAEAGEVVVAYPWNRLERAKEMGRALVQLLNELLDTDEPSAETAIAAIGRAASRVNAVGPEPRYAMPRPRIPVIAITGTNGKTTTTRLIAHIAMTAGRTTAWSSTEGVLVNGKMRLRGDYSGPAGAKEVLATPGLEVAVLETARGGLLNRGMAVGVTDVSLVTNVTPDHLGIGGINTVDQLAEVKAIITKVVKPSGWVVLNADDPRVWAMRTAATAKPFCFTLNPQSPAIREAQGMGGQAITVRDGRMVVIHDEGVRDLVALDDVPMTLAGLSEHNVANALAGAAGALALGLPRIAVVEGLKTFSPDAALNPGRMNVYSLPHEHGAVSVIIDMAHNEAGLEALLRVSRGLVPARARLLLGLGTGGDRTDEILGNLGEMAGLGADLVHIVHKEHYLRGRSMENLEHFLREGLARVSVVPDASWETEQEGLEGLLAVASDGDVIALMTHSHQAEIHQWLTEHGATMDDAATIARKARAHRRAAGAPDDVLRHQVSHAISALRLATDADDAPAEVCEALNLLVRWHDSQS